MSSSPPSLSSDNHRNGTHPVINSANSMNQPLPLAAILSLLIIFYVILVFIGIALGLKFCTAITGYPLIDYQFLCCQSTSATFCSVTSCCLCKSTNCCNGQEEAKVCQPCECCCFKIQFK